MYVHSTQKQNAQPPDLQTVFREFARLSLRANEADNQQEGVMASTLLERIMKLYSAQRGAIVLVNAQDRTPTKKITAFGERILALAGIDENEMRQFLAKETPGEQEDGMDEYCWYRADLPLKEIQTKQPIVAVILLGWPAATYNSQETTSVDTIAQQQEQDPPGTLHHSQDKVTGDVQSIVLLVEDAVKSIISNMLLTERVQELENATPTEAIQEVEQLKTELLSMMGHELRSPLTSIKGYAATLLRYDTRLRREEQREFLEAIRDASDTLSVIVDRLLEMAEFEEDAIQLHLSSVDMLHLTREAIDAAEHARLFLHATAAHPGFFTFPVHVTDEQGRATDTVPLVQGDQRRLREVLDNILENAMKFSPDGNEITLTLRPVTTPPPEAARSQPGAMPTSPALPMLEIAVQDHGIGIADDHLSRIFDRFHRVDTRLTREVNGLGLGLTICKCIVALHHGYLWAESQPGEGSTFYIWLPLAQTTQIQSSAS
jgi:signal transduction histidine kinase